MSKLFLDESREMKEIEEIKTAEEGNENILAVSPFMAITALCIAYLLEAPSFTGSLIHINCQRS